MTDDTTQHRPTIAVVPFPALELLLRLRQQAPTSDDIRQLSAAAGEFLAHRGAVHLERCIDGLPATPHKFRICLRDEALRQALRALRRTMPTAHAAELAIEWHRFVSRGRWARLRREPALPADLTELDRALFDATNDNDGHVLSAKQLGRIVNGRRHGRRLDVSPSPVDIE